MNKEPKAQLPVGKDRLVAVVMNAAVSCDAFSVQRGELLRCSRDVARRLIDRGDAQLA